MAKQRVISTKFWDDSYIINLDPVEKLLFLYLLTNPLTNICGIYEITLRRIAFDTGIDSEMVLKILARFEKEKRVLYKKNWICLVNFIKNQSLNPSVVEGIRRELRIIPKDIRIQFATACDSLRTGSGLLNLTKLNLTKLNALATGSKKNPFYKGDPMRKFYGKWQVLVRGEWKEFAGDEKDIEWK